MAAPIYAFFGPPSFWITSCCYAISGIIILLFSFTCSWNNPYKQDTLDQGGGSGSGGSSGGPCIDGWFRDFTDYASNPIISPIFTFFEDTIFGSYNLK